MADDTTIARAPGNARLALLWLPGVMLSVDSFEVLSSCIWPRSATTGITADSIRFFPPAIEDPGIVAFSKIDHVLGSFPAQSLGVHPETARARQENIACGIDLN